MIRDTSEPTSRSRLDASSSAEEESSNNAPLSGAQLELIDYFAALAETFSQPRSAGQIYGLLFGQPQPLAFDEIVELLGISKGSASGSLKLLRRLKAVHPRHELGDRRTFYEAETSVRHLVQAFLKNGVKAHLKESDSRLEEISLLLTEESEEDESSELLQRRLASLRTWHQKARKLLPWIARLTIPKKDREPD